MALPSGAAATLAAAHPTAADTFEGLEETCDARLALSESCFPPLPLFVGVCVCVLCVARLFTFCFPPPRHPRVSSVAEMWPILNRI